MTGKSVLLSICQQIDLLVMEACLRATSAGIVRTCATMCLLWLRLSPMNMVSSAFRVGSWMIRSGR